MPHARPDGLCDHVYTFLLEEGDPLPLSEITHRLASRFTEAWIATAIRELVAAGRVRKSIELFRKVIPRKSVDQVQEYRATVYSAVRPRGRRPKVD